jgi:hypothetical protein
VRIAPIKSSHSFTSMVACENKAERYDKGKGVSSSSFSSPTSVPPVLAVV